LEEVRKSVNLSKEEVSMQVTEVRVFPVDEDKLRAYVTITLDHCFVIRDLKIIKGTTGYFVSMPSKKRKDGTYKDIAHPINNETRRMLEEKVIAEYEKVVAEGGSQRALGSG
jgi:stage V sporulation protein G